MSALDICNDALGVVGKQDINDLKDPEPAARQCNKFYARTLREIQARFNWEYNHTTKDIAAQTAASKIPGYLHAHLLPADYARFSALDVVEDTDANLLDATFSPVIASNTSYEAIYVKNGTEAPVAMRVADGKIHTNFTPIRLSYHRYEMSTANMPELIRAALVAQLAAKLCFPLTRDTKLTAEIRGMAAEAVMFAQDEEDKDELTETPMGSTFQDARR